jgi:hypothetical protein
VHQGTPSQTLHLRENSEALHYNSPDCPVYTGQCPVLQRRASLNSPASGICSAIIHRTCPVHTGLSGVPPDSVRCTRELDAQLFTFGNFKRRSAIIHRTVRCTTGQCPVPQGRAALNSPALGIRSAIIHRTCPVHTGLSGEPAEQRLLRANGHLQKQLMRARARRSQARAKWRTGHSTVHVQCATGHLGGPSSQSSNGRNPTAW